MNLADGIILVVIAVSALLSVRRGFTREAFSLLTWVAAFIIARLFSPALEIVLQEQISTPSLRTAVAFGTLFALTLIVGALINHLLGELIRVTGLSSTDRLLGMVFGALRGVLLMVVLVALGRHLFAADKWWQDSTLVPHLVMMETWTREMGENVLAWVMNTSS
ncbi:MAG: colicin V production CvpA [Alcanivoracaceae bacterium]|uniref:CvpA family protein n=1 Tax=Alcanivorax profundi TaxID=2338368 RepID=A0A418Y3N2_9GAMM|nr:MULTISPECIES: CvpA family protein [Alcanivorax]MAX54274.1 colicin V production CvpA [Alcanivoracaceae bacterium]MCG8437631.1 CvpA family protein [Pseudomonadales bacterium]MED5432637.1 CvpA family protein [Pseudomonadota bacterium]ERP86601.1 colicin V production CvpA [Alcanivorax sp. P2S70]MEE2871037.1 CvpA family protein [Pseudomonadota bacterium]|tara:strand:+ start:422 stop:913 length:492 start_codon:yes stop_codon:yes gene_type:complete